MLKRICRRRSTNPQSHFYLH